MSGIFLIRQMMENFFSLFLLCFVIYNQFLSFSFIAFLYSSSFKSIVCVCIYFFFFSSRVNHGINWFYLMRHDKIFSLHRIFSSSQNEGRIKVSLSLAVARNIDNRIGTSKISASRGGRKRNVKKKLMRILKISAKKESLKINFSSLEFILHHHPTSHHEKCSDFFISHKKFFKRLNLLWKHW